MTFIKYLDKNYPVAGEAYVTTDQAVQILIAMGHPVDRARINSAESADANGNRVISFTDTPGTKG